MSVQFLGGPRPGLNQTYFGAGVLSSSGGSFIVSVDGVPAQAAVYIYDSAVKSILVGRTVSAADGTWSFTGLEINRSYFILAVAADGRSCGFDGVRPV